MDEQTRTQPIRVVILEDHQSNLDGYLYRLGNRPDIAVVATPRTGEELEAVLPIVQPVHVLLLDVEVPTSAENKRNYPILHVIPKLRERYAGMNILVISMHSEPALIRAVVDAGAQGFVFKDDRATQETLASVVQAVAAGGMHFSKDAHARLMQKAAGRVQLSRRQIDVLSLCAAYPDKTTSEIGKLLGIADATVRNLLVATYERLDVRSRTAAISRAEELGLLATPLKYGEPG